jgi:hypothetical protein
MKTIPYEDKIFEIFAPDIDLVIEDFRENVAIPMVKDFNNDPKSMMDLFVSKPEILREIVHKMKKMSGLWEALDNNTEMLIERLTNSSGIINLLEANINELRNDELKGMFPENLIKHDKFVIAYELMIESSWDTLAAYFKSRKKIEVTPAIMREEAIVVLKTALVMYKLSNRYMDRILEIS